jgi:hypothetical protein
MGRADVKVSIRRPRGQARFFNRYVVAFHDAAVKYDQFPYPLENVRGVLDIQPDHWECRDFSGTHAGGEIRFEGRSFRPLAEGPPEGGAGRAERPDWVRVSIRGRDVLLDRDFEQALAPAGAPGRVPLQNAWKTLALQGRLNFAADVIDRPDQPQDIDVGVDIKACTMQPAFFPYALSDVGAAVRYARGRVYVGGVTARHGPALLGLREGLLVLKPGGGFRAWFDGIRGRGLVPDDDFLRALPPGLAQGLAPLHLREPLDVETSLILDAPREGERLKVWWDGGAALHNATCEAGVRLAGVDGQVACRGHHNGDHIEGLAGDVFLDRATILSQPFRNLHARLRVLPDSPAVLRVSDLKADLFGGTVGGEARVEFGSPLHYEVLLEALQVRLEEFAKHNLAGQADVQGPARAGLHLVGEGTDLSGLRGNGRLQVDRGKMYRLPLLLDLVKAFGLRLPDGTAFEQARMTFGIDGPQMRIGQLDLLGSAVSLRGQGTLNLDGSDLNLDFSADWGRVPELLPAGISDLSQALSDQVFRIKMRGAVGDVHFDKELLPGVVDPIRRAMGLAP